jgi:hypothetical protein
MSVFLLAVWGALEMAAQREGSKEWRVGRRRLIFGDLGAITFCGSKARTRIMGMGIRRWRVERLAWELWQME